MQRLMQRCAKQWGVNDENVVHRGVCQRECLEVHRFMVFVPCWKEVRGVQAARSSISEHQTDKKCIPMPKNKPIINAHITRDRTFTGFPRVIYEANSYI